MKLIKAVIKNFRLLYDVDITFDQNATSIVGKNNTGKTSLSFLFDTFLNKSSNKPPLKFEDFSLRTHARFLRIYKCYKNMKDGTKERLIEIIQRYIPKIQLFLTIKYCKEDNWANITPFLINLDDGDEFTILCEYAPNSTEKFLKTVKMAMNNVQLSEVELLKKIEIHYENHYKINIRPYSESEETENVTLSVLKKLIQSRFIDAQRVLDDSNTESRSKLSKVFQAQFINENERDDSKAEELLNIIEKASNRIDGELHNFFLSFIEYFSKFGFPGIGGGQVELKSQLKPDNLFKNSIKLFYTHDGKALPENYNGLGYSNLIYILSQIIGFYSEIKDFKNNLNLIFVEEPEAHMHPQMQCVFIKNMKDFLNDVGLNAQIIMTTHSSHILSGSELQSIRYFTKNTNANSVVVKDLMYFNKKLDDSETKEFLMQYLTLGKCDLFFADKAILFEGTVERILLPVFIEKIDDETNGNKLSEQYVSSIEVGGAYICKFKELLEFLELKTLIITDIDSIDTGDNRKACEVREGDSIETCNITLSQWIPQKKKITELLRCSNEYKQTGEIRVAYQTNLSLPDQPIKCGRSFEEAFIIDNVSARPTTPPAKK